MKVGLDASGDGTVAVASLLGKRGRDSRPESYSQLSPLAA